MSVLIKGMEMPKNCTICRFCVPEADPENGEMCMATGKYVPPCNTDRLENCPLVEVSPHGPLIDGGDLMQEFAEFVRRSNNSDFAPVPGWNDAVSLLESAPTIIEAEEGEEDDEHTD